jgi:N-terminal domain of toast_rack, DUF2154
MGLIVALLVLTGCEFDNTVTGPVKDQTISLDLNNAQRANVEFDLNAGELTVRGGSPKLLQGHVEYNVPQWQPQVTDSNDGQTANVIIRQASTGHTGGNRRNRWDMELNDNIVLDLKIQCGAGRARLELGDLAMNTVSVQMGAGQVDMDLSGHPTRSYSVNVAGGVGQATVRLPHGVGIRAQAHGGLGSINVEGLTKHGDYYSNDLYGNSKINVLVQVEGGIGEIKLVG